MKRGLRPVDHREVSASVRGSERAKGGGGLMRFKIDENLHPQVAAFLCDLGHDAVTVWDQGLRGKSDSGIAEVCPSENRALLTLDTGFADIRSYLFGPSTGVPRVSRVMPEVTKPKACAPRVAASARLIEAEPLAGGLSIVDEQRAG